MFGMNIDIGPNMFLELSLPLTKTSLLIDIHCFMLALYCSRVNVYPVLIFPF